MLSLPSDDDKQTIDLPAAPRSAAGIVYVPEPEITCAPAAGTLQESSAHMVACVPGVSRAFSVTAASPSQESAASGRTLTVTCALLSEDDCDKPQTANRNPMQMALFSMRETQFRLYPGIFAPAAKNL